MTVMTRNKKRYKKEVVEFCSKFIRPNGEQLFSCGAGLNVCVDAYGKLQPCMLLRHPETVYDLLGASGSSPLRDALNNFFPILRQRKAENQEYKARCARCFLKGLCDQCPAKSWMEHGTLDTPVEYLCSLTHAEARYLGLISESENAWDVNDWHSRIAQLSRRIQANTLDRDNEFQIQNDLTVEEHFFYGDQLSLCSHSSHTPQLSTPTIFLSTKEVYDGQERMD